MDIFSQVISEKETFRGTIKIAGIFQSLELLSKKHTEIILLTYSSDMKIIYVYEHRLDGEHHSSTTLNGIDPAVYDSNGFMAWGLAGKLHGFASQRDGPARIDKSKMEWYEYGKRHRVDGPAVIYTPSNTHTGKIYTSDNTYIGIKEMWFIRGRLRRLQLINGRVSKKIIDKIESGDHYYYI